MQQSSSIWQGGGAQVVVVSFEPPELLRRLAVDFTREFRFVSDSERTLYQAFGLGSAGWREAFSQDTIRAYLRALRNGAIFRMPRRDLRERADYNQLGGDFVVDTDGRLLLEHRSRTPADRPTLAEIESALRAPRGA